LFFPEQQDHASLCSGYAGSLILWDNLTMVMMPEWYGISDGPIVYFFLSVGIQDWFAQITFITFQ
jgi:UMF1 family MFS transporter